MLMIRSVSILLLGLALSSMAIGKDTENLPAIALTALMAGYPVTILGENHRRPESTQLIADLVDPLTDNGGRWLTLEHPRSMAAIQETLSVAAIHQPETMAAVADGAVVWECAPP